VSELVFRRAGPEDAERVRDLTLTAYAKWVPVIGRRPKPMNADYDHAVNAHIVELAYLEGELAGVIELIPAPDHLLLENIAVAPAHQRKGIGRRLMAHVEALARARQVPMVRLYTNKAFTSNLEFYRKLGYTLEREEALASGGFLVHFAKSVKAP
jgi:ribosomal protein S18 acetylase RimI-like enzyme